jgi:diguanylate cyclase (GGDEF)-like protein
MKPDESSALLSRLKAAKRLPSPPGTAIRVLELCRRDNVELQEVADLLMCDAALSGRLLKFANSPVSGLGREVTSIRQAVLLLGLRTVMLLSLGFSLSSSDHRPQCNGFEINKFWAESFASGVIARHLAQNILGLDREEAFTAALMSGIGKLALAQGIPEEYSKVMALVKSGSDLVQAEQQILGIDHIGFGSQLLEDWGLPEVLISAVALQNTATDTTNHAHSLARAVRAAAGLAPIFVRGDDVRPQQVHVAKEIVKNILKLDETQWKQISEQIQIEYMQLAEVFEVKLESASQVLDLYAEAQEEASRVGVVAQLQSDEVSKTNENLVQRAFVDALTGVPNRAKFDEKLEELVKGNRRGHGHFALIIFDIDHFKKFNDKYGHPVGDLVLKRVGRAVQNCLRDVDLLARYGGEEFAILAPHTDRRASCVVAARVRKCVEDLCVDHEGERLRVTISVGVAVTVDYPAAPTAEQILSDADKQLYLSKNTGRNTWSYSGRSAAQLVKA